MDWIFKNLNDNDFGDHDEGWQSIFMVTCWHLWTCRNKSIFEDGFRRLNNPLLVTRRTIKEIEIFKHTCLTVSVDKRRPFTSVGICIGNASSSTVTELRKVQWTLHNVEVFFQDSDSQLLQGHTQDWSLCHLSC